MSIVYLNGAYLPKAEAKISVEDRGFLFGDGVYEVTSFYGGVAFALDRHLERLERGLAFMRIRQDVADLEVIHRELIARNGLESAERSLVYLQITRGAAPRTHQFPPADVPPTVYAHANSWTRPPDGVWGRGFTAVTAPDRRWSRVDIKTVGLLPNVLAYQAAKDLGADDVILVRDGVAIEGAHQNFWAVFDGTAVTHPKTNLILPGITRGVLMELALERGIPVEERAVAVEELERADELFFTGTTGEVRPCVSVDGRLVGDGTVGPVTRALSNALLTHLRGMREEAAVLRR